MSDKQRGALRFMKNNSFRIILAAFKECNKVCGWLLTADEFISGQRL